MIRWFHTCIGVWGIMLLLPGYALAHGLMPTMLHLQSSTEADGTTLWQGRLRIAEPLLQEQAPAARATIATQLQNVVQLRQDDVRCPLQFTPAGKEQGERFSRIVFLLQGQCPTTQAATLAIHLFQRENPQHRIIAHIREGTAPDRFETIVTGAAIQLGSSAPDLHPFLAFLQDGFKHILSGLDHVAFVLAILLATGWKMQQLFTAITAFTLAHTLTLVLASLGVLQPNPIVVEPIIAFSIVITAMEGGTRRRVDAMFLGLLLAAALFAAPLARSQFPLAATAGLLFFAIGYRGLDATSLPARVRIAILPFLFGLVHGLGFAGPLQSLSLPTAETALAIFSFNLGVEAGQISIILCLYGLSRILIGRMPTGLVPIARAAVAGAGGAWFLQRVLAL